MRFCVRNCFLYTCLCSVHHHSGRCTPTSGACFYYSTFINAGWLVGETWLFPRLRGWRNVRPIVPCLHFLYFISRFYSVLASISLLMALSTVFQSVNSSDNCTFSLCSVSLISALLVLSTIYLFLKVFSSPDIILCV